MKPYRSYFANNFKWEVLNEENFIVISDNPYFDVHSW